MASSASRALCLLVCALAICQVASAATPTQVRGAFREITRLSDNLRVTAQGINLVSALIHGGDIAQGFSGIVTKVALSADMLARDGSVFGDADARLVVESLTMFVEVHQALLNVVIGKHGLLTLIPFSEPIRLALVALEASVDNFAFYLIATIPTQEPAADEQFGALGGTVRLAISAYGQPL